MDLLCNGSIEHHRYMIFEVLSRSRTALGGFRGTGWTMTPGPGYIVLQHILYCIGFGIVCRKVTCLFAGSSVARAPSRQLFWYVRLGLGLIIWLRTIYFARAGLPSPAAWSHKPFQSKIRRRWRDQTSPWACPSANVRMINNSGVLWIVIHILYFDSTL